MYKVLQCDRKRTLKQELKSQYKGIEFYNSSPLTCTGVQLQTHVVQVWEFDFSFIYITF